MNQNLFGEVVCTPGHEEQCRLAKCKDCACNCGGKNHGTGRIVTGGVDHHIEIKSITFSRIEPKKPKPKCPHCGKEI